MVLKGKAVSRGVALGPVLRYAPFQPVLTKELLPAGGAEAALAAYRAARAAAQKELDGLERRLASADPEQAKIMAAHRDILLDPAMDEEITDLVNYDGVSPDAAADQVFRTYAGILRGSDNPLMRERAADLLDVLNRLLRCWAGAPERDLSRLDRPVIVVADDLYPSDTAAIDRKNVLGIITQTGGSTSHTAIIARGYGIPAILGVPNAMEALEDGQKVVLDGETGEIIADPSEAEEAAYRRKSERVAAALRDLDAFLDAEPVTRDGVRVQVRLNVAAAGERELSSAEHVDGCGLFRTEFLYLNREQLPGEEEQYLAYRKVLERFGDKPVILRTMDIGGDKQFPGSEELREDNPFLGLRGLRLSLERPELFRVQARAILRASVHGNMKVMMPMVGSLEEYRQAKAVFAGEMDALDREGIPWDRDLRLGIMIEVPSIALIADLAAQEVDFASVGTNDLTQYLCAADRVSPSVRAYYKEYHPAVFRTLAYLARAFRDAGRELSICGELGGDPLAIPALVGLGIRQLSMGAASVPAAKRVIRSLDLPAAERLAEEVLHQKTQEDVRACLERFASGLAGQEKEA